MAKFYLDPAAHPYIPGELDQINSRVTFENLDSVDVQGVWNQPVKRIEF